MCFLQKCVFMDQMMPVVVGGIWYKRGIFRYNLEVSATIRGYTLKRGNIVPKAVVFVPKAVLFVHKSVFVKSQAEGTSNRVPALHKVRRPRLDFGHGCDAAAKARVHATLPRRRAHGRRCHEGAPHFDAAVKARFQASAPYGDARGEAARQARLPATLPRRVARSRRCREGAPSCEIAVKARLTANRTPGPNANMEALQGRKMSKVCLFS